MEDGSGLKALIPPLSAENLRLDDPGKLVCLIRHGLPRNPDTNQQMPPQPTLKEAEYANLINYLGVLYANKTQVVRADEVKTMLAACQSR